jgi:hypothetical protein
MTSSTKNAVKESLMQGYFTINKKLMKQLGGIEVLFLSYLIDKESYWESAGKLADEGWFFKNAYEIEKELDIGKVQRKKIYNKLIDMGLIEMKRMGTPNKWYYRICWVTLGEYMANDLPEEQYETLINDDDDHLEEDIQNDLPNGTQKYPMMVHKNDPLEAHKNAPLEGESHFRGSFLCAIDAHKNAPLLPKTTEISLHAEQGGNFSHKSVMEVASKPSVDQIRRSWELTVGSYPAQQDRLPLLRDLMTTLKSFNYTESHLPRNMGEVVTAHWWSKAKDKKQKEAMRERSLKDYDSALVDLSEIIEITSAPKMKNKAQKKPKVANQAALASLDALIDQIDQGLLDETEEFYKQMLELAEKE